VGEAVSKAIESAAFNLHWTHRFDLHSRRQWVRLYQKLLKVLPPIFIGLIVLISIPEVSG